VSIAHQGRYAEAATIVRSVAKELGMTVELQDPDGWILLAALAAHARGFQLSHQGRCEEAKVALEEALRIAPGLADARYHLGFCLMKLGDRKGAERELRSAIAGYARTERVLQASAQYSLGNLLWELGAGPAREAVALLERAMAPEGQGTSRPSRRRWNSSSEGRSRASRSTSRRRFG
jgi:tetratricopeptide (TPR) repeat protein